MKSTNPLKALICGFVLIPTFSSMAALSFLGATAVWNADSASTADTIGGNPAWNVYLRDSAGTYVNGGDGDDTRFSVDLTEGTHTFDLVLHHQSWVDGSVASPGLSLNLFFDDRATPGISAKLAGGNFGAIAALTAADLATVPNDLDGSSVAPAGSLSYQGSDLKVSLTNLAFSTGPDDVDAFKSFPTGKELDSIVSVTLTVVPEPSTGILALSGLLFFVSRRRRQ